MLIAPALLVAALDSTKPKAEAYTGTQPVQVASCSFAPAVNIGLPYYPVATTTGAVNISFVNQAPQTITAVTFSVTDGRSSSEIVDKGKFSNGVAINHSFTAPEFSNGDTDLSCSLESVAFADGTSWKAQ